MGMSRTLRIPLPAGSKKGAQARMPGTNAYSTYARDAAAYSMTGRGSRVQEDRARKSGGQCWSHSYDLALEADAITGLLQSRTRLDFRTPEVAESTVSLSWAGPRPAGWQHKTSPLAVPDLHHEGSTEIPASGTSPHTTSGVRRL